VLCSTPAADKSADEVNHRLEETMAKGSDKHANRPGAIDDAAAGLWELLPDYFKSAWRSTRVLGRGAFGVVVHAEKRQNTRVGADLDSLEWAENCDIAQQLRCDDGQTAAVAVKLVPLRQGGEPIAMREGLVLSLLDFEHIPKCFDYGISNGVAYTVLEYLDGVPLDQVLAQEGPLAPLEVAKMGVEVGESLADLHRAGFLFRDLKPSNIIRLHSPGRGHVYRLVDFGSATGVDGCVFGGGRGREGGECSLDHYGIETEERLRQVFRAVDREKSGSISTRELAECFKAYGMQDALARTSSLSLVHQHVMRKQNLRVREKEISGCENGGGGGMERGGGGRGGHGLGWANQRITGDEFFNML